MSFEIIAQYDPILMKQLAKEVAELQGEFKEFEDHILRFFVASANRGAAIFTGTNKIVRARSLSWGDLFLINQYDEQKSPVRVWRNKSGRLEFSDDFINYVEIFSQYVSNLLSNPFCPLSILLSNETLASPMWPLVARNPILPLMIEADLSACNNIYRWYAEPNISKPRIGYERHEKMTLMESIATKKYHDDYNNVREKYVWEQIHYSDDWLLNWLQENLQIVGCSEKIPRPEKSKKTNKATIRSIEKWLVGLSDQNESYFSSGLTSFYSTTLRSLDRRPYRGRHRESNFNWRWYGNAFLMEIIKVMGTQGVFVFIDRCRVMAKRLEIPFPYHVLSEILGDAEGSIPNDICKLEI